MICGPCTFGSWPAPPFLVIRCVVRVHELLADMLIIGHRSLSLGFLATGILLTRIIAAAAHLQDLPPVFIG